MKPRAPERYGTDEQALSAHQILGQHVTNVSPITAKAIERAVDEYDALLVKFEAQRAEQVATVSPDSLKRLCDAVEVLARAAQVARAVVDPPPSEVPEVAEEPSAGWPRGGPAGSLIPGLGNGNNGTER